MSSFSLPPAIRRLSLAMALACSASASFAMPVMDMHLEDLLPMAQDFKQELNLNANQQILWQQMESKTHQLLRERVSRREHLQTALQQGLMAPKLELRDMAPTLDAETAASAAEEKQLREWWLTVNDALDEHQRQQVAQFLSGQLARVMDGAPQHDAPARPKSDGAGGGGRKGGGRGGMGGAGGTPGMGGPGG